MVNHPLNYVELNDENRQDNEDKYLRKRLRSDAWNYFDRKKIDGKIKAICKYCKKKYGGDSSHGTRHLNDHAKTCFHKKQSDIARYSKKLKKVEDTERNIKVETYSFDPNLTRELIARMIIVHEYPLSYVEHE